jgi:Holliday junction resolvase RusA-like endonuclease
MQVFLAMEPPTTTHQEKQVRVAKGKPVFFEPPALKDARAKLMAHLGRHRPEAPATGPVRCVAKWLFPATGKHRHGEWKETKPDVDNLTKLLHDCMTDAGYWLDDAQVVSSVVEKFWSDTPGIFLQVEELG